MAKWKKFVTRFECFRPGMPSRASAIGRLRRTKGAGVSAKRVDYYPISGLSDEGRPVTVWEVSIFYV